MQMTVSYLIRGWVNYFRIANMRQVIIDIDKHLRTRIRVIKRENSNLEFPLIFNLIIDYLNSFLSFGNNCI